MYTLIEIKTFSSAHPKKKKKKKINKMMGHFPPL